MMSNSDALVTLNTSQFIAISATEDLIQQKANNSSAIVIEDLIDLPSSSDPVLEKLLSALTINDAAKTISFKVAASAIMATALNAILGTWLANHVIFSSFITLAIFTFFISLLADRSETIKSKVFSLTIELFLVAVIAAITEIVFKELQLIDIPVLSIKIPIFSSVCFFMILHYLIIDLRYAFTVTSLANAKLIKAFTKSSINAASSFKDTFSKTLQNDIVED